MLNRTPTKELLKWGEVLDWTGWDWRVFGHLVKTKQVRSWHARKDKHGKPLGYALYYRADILKILTPPS